MTIRAKFQRNHAGTIGKFVSGVLLVLCLWFAALAIVPRIDDGAGQYIVVGPHQTNITAISSTRALIISAGRGYLQVQSNKPGLVAQLYDGGAWLVLPASNGGCISLTDWRRLVTRKE